MSANTPKTDLYLGLSLIALSFVVRFAVEKVAGEGSFWTALAAIPLVWGFWMIWDYIQDSRKARKQK